MSFLKSAIAALALGATTLPAAALTVQFASPNWNYNNTSASQQADWRVSIDDNTAGKLTFRVGIDAGSSAIGDILGIGFNTSMTLGNFAFVSSSTGERITGTYTNTRRCGGGCNFNGATSTNFDYIVRAGDQGSSAGRITSFIFTADTADGLAADSFSRVGIRSQSLGAAPFGGGDSSKDINSMPEISPVPLPAAIWLLGAGLGGLGFVGRKRRS